MILLIQRVVLSYVLFTLSVGRTHPVVSTVYALQVHIILFEQVIVINYESLQDFWLQLSYYFYLNDYMTNVVDSEFGDFINDNYVLC